MEFAPENLQRCPNHPEALVRHVYDEYAWQDGCTPAPLRKQTVGYECAACGHKLEMEVLGGTLAAAALVPTPEMSASGGTRDASPTV